MTKGEENGIKEFVNSRGKSVLNNPTSINDNNPYNNRTYEETLWDKIVSGFGGRSTYDKLEAERLQNKANWDSQYSLLKEQQEYDSAEQQAKRERDAGINPNLSANVDAGDSKSELSPDSPISSSGEMFADIDTTMSDIGQGIETAVMFAFQLAGSGQSLALGAENVAGAKIANDAKTLDIVNSLDTTAENWITKYLNDYLNSGQDFYIKDENGNWIVNNKKVSDEVRLRQMQAMRDVFLSKSDMLLEAVPKKYRRALSSRLSTMFDSVYGKTIKAKGINEMADVAPKRAVAQRILNGFETQGEVNDFKPISDFAISMSNSLFEAHKMRAKLEEKVLKLQSDEVDAHEVEVEANKGMAKIRAYLNDEMQNSVESLLDVRDNGNPLEKLGASIAIFSLCGLNFSGSPDFGASSILKDFGIGNLLKKNPITDILK